MRRILPALFLVVACMGGPIEPAPEVEGKAIPDSQDRGEVMVTENSGGGEEPERQAPKFAGKTIPDPTSQGSPWTPPATKLPRSFVDATAALFELGTADPRGCDYREVEVGDWRVEKVRGFVMPERPGEAGQFAVGWDGVLRPALAVGAKVDLEADVLALAVVLKKSRESPQFITRLSRNTSGTTTQHRETISPFFDDREPATAVPRSPLTLCMLLRLGRADLAESVYAAATTWTPDSARPDLTDEHISFPSLSRGWADILYSRLIGAHCRGDDAVALDTARRLDRFRKAVEAKAEALGLKRDAPRRKSYEDPAYVRNPNVITDLLADQERRAKEAPRGPVPARGGNPAARIAALIRDFDQIHVVQMEDFGGADPGDGAIVGDVVAEGDPAVGPLLSALESDTRLTRCVFSRNGIDQPRPVTKAVYGALQRLLKTERFMDNMSDYTELQTAEGRKRLARVARAFWEKNREVPLVERWYRALRDDSAGEARWFEAATGLVQPSGRGAPFMGYFTVRRPGQPQPTALMGEPLRERRDPGVSALLARRCAAMAGTGKALTIPDIKLLQACDLALRFTWWDEVGSLPTIKALMTTCRERSLDPEQASQSGGYARYIAEFTIVRARAGDRAGLDEYAAWVQAIEPGTIEHSWREVLEPLWTYPERAAVSQAARAMFVDPKSHWLPLIPVNDDRRDYQYADQIASPLACVPAYREALLAALADKAKVGTAVRKPGGLVEYTLAAGRRDGFADVRVPDRADRPGIKVPIRTCDYVAWKLSALDGAPECLLTWPEARRDKAVAACAEYLRRYGPRLAAEYPPDEPDARNPIARLRLPALERLATPDDVREGRAVFSSTGEGEARVVALPSGYPVRARWLALKSFPVDRRSSPDPGLGDFLQDGWVWQAEEVLKGGRWERFYGFVGHATIARVAASEIEFSPDRNRRLILPGGLSARVETAEPPIAVFRPGQPVLVTLRLHNARGVERSVPTEFVRAGADGKPALRRGVSLVLEELPKGTDGPGVLGSCSFPPRKPTRTDRFDPGNASRTLAPTESFEAVRLDLNDWYAGLQPGGYWLELKFGADSGVGEGRTNFMEFWIAEPDKRGQ